MERPTRPILFQIEVPLSSEWRNVELLRTSVLNCLTTIFSNSDFCNTIGMVTGELLENALKFGDWANQASFRLKVYGGRDDVVIEVHNPVADQAKELVETVDWINAQPDAKTAFMNRLAEVHEHIATSDSSRLGLVRIAYEGSCSLSVAVNDGVVCVTAKTRP